MITKEHIDFMKWCLKDIWKELAYIAFLVAACFVVALYGDTWYNF